jgi:hypothetical protein
LAVFFVILLLALGALFFSAHRRVSIIQYEQEQAALNESEASPECRLVISSPDVYSEIGLVMGDRFRPLGFKREREGESFIYKIDGLPQGSQTLMVSAESMRMFRMVRLDSKEVAVAFPAMKKKKVPALPLPTPVESR